MVKQEPQVSENVLHFTLMQLVSKPFFFVMKGVAK